MEKEKRFHYTSFSVKVLRKAFQELLSCVDLKEADLTYQLSVTVGDELWSHDSIEEFFADYRKASGWIYFRARSWKPRAELVLSSSDGRHSDVSVAFTDRPNIERVFEVFENHAQDSKLPGEPFEPPPVWPTIFVGHGRSFLWRDLKDHLQDQHGFEVAAYEVGARAGHVIRDILEEMLGESSFAILVMTGEDATKDELLIPRLNVVHELGLFQGRLGFSKAIVLLEEGTQEFSNIHGMHQIRFTKGKIKETFGDVLATLRREFPEQSD